MAELRGDKICQKSPGLRIGLIKQRNGDQSVKIFHEQRGQVGD